MKASDFVEQLRQRRLEEGRRQYRPDGGPFRFSDPREPFQDAITEATDGMTYCDHLPKSWRVRMARRCFRLAAILLTQEAGYGE